MKDMQAKWYLDFFTPAVTRKSRFPLSLALAMGL
jgi:hypothetical protein